VKGLLNIGRRKSVNRVAREMRQSTGREDRQTLIILLIGGILLVSVCHYSLVQLSEFYSLVIAVVTAERNQSAG
jgi:uncharacterized membrane protein